MIQFENVVVNGWEAAIRGMRNPLNSWSKMDSYEDWPEHPGIWVFGQNDLNLMHRLANAGSDHGKFLRYINVTVDITAPLYWWKEFDTYKVGTVANSCQTMHKIQAKEFELTDFSHDQLFDGVGYRETDDPRERLENPTTCLEYTIRVLNYYRRKYNETKDKKYWWQMIQLLPSSYNQRRTVQLNYATARLIRNSDRRNHKLDEWRIGFMDFLDSMPLARELIVDEKLAEANPDAYAHMQVYMNSDTITKNTKEE